MTRPLRADTRARAARRPLPDRRLARRRPRASGTRRRRRPEWASAASAWSDVASYVGLDFRHGAFRFETTPDPVAMMGGGVCWLDYDGDGWLDLYAVNSHSIAVDVARWKERGGLPRNALYRNVKGTFTDVSRGSGADLQLRGNGCVAADFNRRWADRPLRHGCRLRRAPLERGRRAGSSRAHALRGSTPTAGTRRPLWATSTPTAARICSSRATPTSTLLSPRPRAASRSPMRASATACT